MASIKEIEQEIIQEFSLFDDWMDKYNYLIELGGKLPAMDEKHKTQQYLIEGCQSKVWLHAEYKDGKVHFTADGDAVITKGLVSLLIRVLSGQSTKDIFEADLEFINKIGLDEHLSPTRSNGLLSMAKQMKMYAKAFEMKHESNVGGVLKHDQKEDLKKKVENALQYVYDPEIPVNIFELGLIYEVKVLDENHCHILMTLTSPNCPVAESMPAEVRENVQRYAGFSHVEVEITFEPPWTPDMMSEAAKIELDMM